MRSLVLAQLAIVLGCHSPAFADRISNPVAMFAGLDKITG